MSRRPSAFTLIEILISLAIGMSMVAVAWGCLAQIQRTTTQVRAKVNLHQEAGSLHAILREMFGSVFNGGQFRIAVANAGGATAQVTIDVMATLDQPFAEYGRDPTASRRNTDLTWRRLRWTRDATSGAGTLRSASLPSEWQVVHRGTINIQSNIQTQADPYDASRLVPVWTNEDIVPVVTASSNDNAKTMVLGPSVRRDRRRSLLDNDLRLVPNIPNATWLKYTTTAAGARIRCSDDEILDDRLAVISTRVTALRLELIDYRGMVTRVNLDDSAWSAPVPPAGISYVLGGVTLNPPTPASPDPDVWSSTLRVIDGTWADGRNTPCPAYPTMNLPNPALERPALVRVEFTLSDTTQNVQRSFSFSFAPTVIQVQP